MSPFPSSFSAPLMSSIVRESTCDDTANAMRLGMFAFIMPVMTSTDGRCVAMTRCIPAALAICARRHMASSTSLGAAIIRSASSSMITTICGIWSIGSPFSFLKPREAASVLYALRSLTLLAAKILYLLSISVTAQLSAPAALRGSVTTGTSR